MSVLPAFVRPSRHRSRHFVPMFGLGLVGPTAGLATGGCGLLGLGLRGVCCLGMLDPSRSDLQMVVAWVDGLVNVSRRPSPNTQEEALGDSWVAPVMCWWYSFSKMSLVGWVRHLHSCSD